MKPTGADQQQTDEGENQRYEKKAAVTGLVAGAIVGAKELGVSAKDAAAAAAADGALKAAGQVGATAVESVRKAVSKPINGVKVVLKEPRLTKAA